MNRYRHAGGCHCGALRWTFETAQVIGELAPRACDCDFCTRHGAAWVSDAHGALRIESRGDTPPARYRQGSGQAEFLCCTRCGVLVAVIAVSDGGKLLGAANRNAFEQRDGFPAATVVSPQKLDASTKLARWTQLWTPVELATS